MARWWRTLVSCLAKCFGYVTSGLSVISKKPVPDPKDGVGLNRFVLPDAGKLSLLNLDMRHL